MNNGIIKKLENKENEVKIAQEIVDCFFSYEESKILGINKCAKREYVDEEDEIDEQGYLKKARNVNLKLLEEHYEISVEKKNNQKGTCPCCGKEVSKVHDYYNRYIQDIVFGGITIFIKYKVKRFYCSHCGKNFSEENRDFPKGQKYTTRLGYQIMMRLKENCSRATIAREENVSENYVKKILDMCAFKKKELGEAICIDEFKGNLRSKVGDVWVTRKYQTLLKNPENGEIIDILPSRDYRVLAQYFSEIPESERDKVKYFISDMNSYFIKLGKKYFKKAKIVIDRFHYTKAITEAFEKIRKGSQKYLTGKDRKKYKNMRKILLMHKTDLERMENGKEMVEEMLSKMPLLRRAYNFMQQFYDINKSESRERARIELHQFYRDVEGYKNIFFMEAVETIKRHEKGILDSFETPYTNAYAEGTNNLIKVIKRVGYGLKNLERFKKKLELIVNNYIEIRIKKKEHKLVREGIRKARKEYSKKIKAAIEIAA